MREGRKRVDYLGGKKAQLLREIANERLPAVRSLIAVRVMNANLATLIEAPGVLDAGAFAIVLCGAETLLVCVERPRENQHDQTHKHSCGDHEDGSRLLE